MRRLASRAEEVIGALDPESAPVRVCVFREETAQTAMARHVMLRPEHRGKRFKLEYRRYERNEVNELFGAHSLTKSGPCWR